MTLRLHSFKCYHKSFDIVAEQDSKPTLLPANIQLYRIPRKIALIVEKGKI